MSDVVDHGGDSCRKWYAERTVEPDFPELEAYLRVGSRVLEVGCGPGTITLDVARRVAPGQVVGVDIASASVEEANARARNSGIDNVRFELADTVDLPYEADSFDLVYSNQVLMYVKDPVRALQEQRRVARRGGRVVAQGDDRASGVFFPPCPHTQEFFASLAQVSDSSSESFVADFLFARRAYGMFVEAGFRKLELTPSHPPINWVHAGQPRIGEFFGDRTRVAWSGLSARLLSLGIINKTTMDLVRAELDVWRRHPHAFYCCVSVVIAGQVG